MARWIALFSQTGSEIVNLSKLVGRKPDVVCSNNLDKDSWVKGLGNVHVGSHDELMQILLNTESDALVTLHGYLRIIPPEVVKALPNMYNGHPGLISFYPELKGKDPQERAMDYKFIGSVVHKVTEGVDEGKIISQVAYTNRASSVESIYNTCKQASLNAWVHAMRDIL